MQAAHNLGTLLAVRGDAAGAISVLPPGAPTGAEQSAYPQQLGPHLRCGGKCGAAQRRRGRTVGKTGLAQTGNKNLQFLETLAAAYAESGDFVNAVATTNLALQLAEAQRQEPLVRLFRARLAQYRDKRPLRE